MTTEPVEGVGDEFFADPNRLLTSSEVAALLNIERRTWSSYVRRGYAPQPDEPELDRPANRRTPRWKLSTVVEYNRTKKRRMFRKDEAGVRPRRTELSR